MVNFDLKTGTTDQLCNLFIVLTFTEREKWEKFTFQVANIQAVLHQTVLYNPPLPNEKQWWWKFVSTCHKQNWEAATVPSAHFVTKLPAYCNLLYKDRWMTFDDDGSF